MITLKVLGKSIIEAGKNFVDDDCTNLSASLSYFTLFALPSFLLIIVYSCSLFFSEEVVNGKLYFQLSQFIGNSAAKQVNEIMLHINVFESKGFGAIVAGAILIFGASGIFTQIQTSVNKIWDVHNAKQGFLVFLRKRLFSFSIILGMGFLLLVSLAMNMVFDLVFKDAFSVFTFSKGFVAFVQLVVIYVSTTALFFVIMHVLPDIRIPYKYSLSGSAFTAFLFIVGKYLISMYIGYSNTDDVYGTAASVVVILIWVYYSSCILFFGVEYTRAVYEATHRGNHPKLQQPTDNLL